MKVLMIGNDSSVRGGITSVIDQLITHNWQVDGIDMSFIPTYIDTGAIQKLVFFIRSYAQIFKKFLSGKPDVVHIHMSYRGSFVRKYLIHKLCRKFGVPDIIHLHGSEFKKWYDESSGKSQAKIRKLLKECSALIVLGEKWKQVILDIVPDANIVVVSNTIKIPQVTTHWNSNPVKFLFLGVLIKRKGVSDLLDAVHLLDQSGDIADAKFLVAGTGEEEDFLKEKVRHLKLEPYIEFIGWTAGAKKEQVLQECQVLVLPSYNEGLPIAVLEAISYGLPVIATDVGDIPAAVHDGVNGFQIKPGDISALSECIYKISKDEDLYKKMSKASREIAETQFSDRTYFEKLKACYYTVGEKK